MCIGADTQVTFNDCAFTENFAGSGGGVLARDGQVTLNDCILANNTATSSGGGLIASNEARTTLNRCLLPWQLGRRDHPPREHRSHGDARARQLHDRRQSFRRPCHRRRRRCDHHEHDHRLQRSGGGSHLRRSERDGDPQLLEPVRQRGRRLDGVHREPGRGGGQPVGRPALLQSPGERLPPERRFALRAAAVGSVRLDRRPPGDRLPERGGPGHLGRDQGPRPPGRALRRPPGAPRPETRPPRAWYHPRPLRRQAPVPPSLGARRLDP